MRLLLLVSSLVFEPAQVSDRIDGLVAAQWEKAGVEAPELSNDAEFLRRVYLDIAGRIPTADEARAFLEAGDPGKRESLVARLLASDDYAEHWARRLGIQLLGRERMPRIVDAAGFEQWLEEELARNTPYDRIVYELVTASGNAVDTPAVNYLLRFEQEPADIAESVASSFLGLSIGCARCHNHPYEAWTPDDFYGMAASFGALDLARPTRADRRARREFRSKLEGLQKQRAAGELSREDRRLMMETFMEGTAGVRRTLRLTDVPRKRYEVEVDGKTRTFSARFLDGTTPSRAAREDLAEWIVGRENPYFARAAVNRVWEAFFGRGLVDPVDAFGEGNPPSHPEVLDLLADDFMDNGFDLRRLVTVIATSRTYQLSSRYAGAGEALPPPELFAVARPRRMSPEQLFDSIVTLAGLEGRARFDERRNQFFRQFVFLFDTDAVDDVEVAQGTIPQSLFLLNGRLTNEALSMTRSGRDLDELFLATLARYPTAEEERELDELFEARDRHARSDLLWALVNSSEFLMVH